MLSERTDGAFRLAASLLCVLTVLAAHSTADAQERPQPLGQYMKEIEITTERVEQMIDVGGRSLHCRVYGTGAPTVVLISGLNAPQSYWNSVVPDLAERATVVTYDRPGIGRSEVGNLPLHGEQSAKELHVLLEKLAVPKPYVVVGHSHGGSVARLFVSMYPKDVSGLILEDCQHESVLEEQRKLLKGQDLAALNDMAARMSNTADPKTEMDYNSMTSEQLRTSAPLPTIPYAVIASGNRSKAVPPGFSDQARGQLIALGMDLQKRLVSLIPGGKHIVAEGVGHNVHVEKPGILLEPLIEMLGTPKAERR
jgi:pimeloyl-ACP methyl ester carboxylesterase